MSNTNWVAKQIENGNLVEDGTGCVPKLEAAAKDLDERLAVVASDDAWALDTSEFAKLAEKYIGFVPKGI